MISHHLYLLFRITEWGLNGGCLDQHYSQNIGRRKKMSGCREQIDEKQKGPGAMGFRYIDGLKERQS